MPAGAVYVGRPTIWGNPWGEVDTFREMLSGSRPISEIDSRLREWRLRILNRIPELRGKQLACWCRLCKPCHADVLAELANKIVTETVSHA